MSPGTRQMIALALSGAASPFNAMKDGREFVDDTLAAGQGSQS